MTVRTAFLVLASALATACRPTNSPADSMPGENPATSDPGDGSRVDPIADPAADVQPADTSPDTEPGAPEIDVAPDVPCAGGSAPPCGACTSGTACVWGTGQCEPEVVPPCGDCPTGTVCVWGTGNCESQMVEVPGGPFMMGWNNPSCGPYCPFPEALPYHQVDVPTFRIDRIEVRVVDYIECMQCGPCTVPDLGDSDRFNWKIAAAAYDPADGINWNKAATYCGWRGKRLCTEAEWEKGARGTDGREYPWGSAQPTCDLGVMYGPGTCVGSWTPDCNSGCGDGRLTMPCGSKPAGASPYGALDMSGNASEWVEDVYHPSYDGAPVDGSAWVEPPNGAGPEERAHRSGAGDPSFMQVWLRGHAEPGLSYTQYGIRCCKSGGE